MWLAHFEQTESIQLNLCSKKPDTKYKETLIHLRLTYSLAKLTIRILGILSITDHFNKIIIIFFSYIFLLKLFFIF